MIIGYKAVLAKTLTQLNITIDNMVKDGWEPSGELKIGEFPVKHLLKDAPQQKNKYTGEYYTPYEIRNVRGYLQVMVQFEED